MDKLLGKGGQTFKKSIFKKHRKASYIHDGGQTFIILKYIKSIYSSCFHDGGQSGQTFK